MSHRRDAAADEHQTPREVKAETARLKQEELEAVVQANSDVQAVQDVLDAAIIGVSAKVDRDLPPALDPEAQL